MGSGSDWIKNETEKRLKAYLASKNIITQPQELQAVEFITFTKSDKSQGKTNSGFIVDTIPKGSVEKSGWGFRVGTSNTYVVAREKERLKGTDSEGSVIELLGYDFFTYNGFIQQSKVKPNNTYTTTIFTLDVRAITGISDTDFFNATNLILRYSKNNNHICVIFVVPTTNAPFLSDGFKFIWGWALNYTLNKSNNTVSWKSLIQKQITFDSTTLPTATPPSRPSIPVPSNLGTVFEQESDPYFNGIGDEDQNKLGYTIDIYDDLAGSPKLNILVNWTSYRQRSTLFRIQSRYSSSGAITCSYDNMQYDAPTGNYYRHVAVNFPTTGVSNWIIVNGSSLSFHPPGYNLWFYGFQEINHVGVTSFPSGAGTGAGALGYYPAWANHPARDTVYGSSYPGFPQQFFPNFVATDAELGNSPVDTAPAYSSLVLRSGIMWFENANSAFIGNWIGTQWYANRNRVFYLAYSIDGAAIQYEQEKTTQVTWDSHPWSSSLGATISGTALVPTFTSSGNTLRVFGSRPFSNSGQPYYGGSAGQSIDLDGLRAASYYGGFPIENNVFVGNMSYTKLVGNNLINSVIKASPDLAFALNYAAPSTEDYSDWSIGSMPNNYFASGTVFSDHKKLPGLVTNEIALLDNYYSSPVIIPESVVTPPFIGDMPNLWDSSTLPNALLKSSGSQTFLQATNDGINLTLQRHAWNDSINRGTTSKTFNIILNGSITNLEDWKF